MRRESGVVFLGVLTGLACGGGYGGSSSSAGAVLASNTMVQTQAGSGQSVAVGTAFATALQAYVFTQQVIDNGYGGSQTMSTAAAGVTVTFTIVAGASGASGFFPGPVAAATATTDASGRATAPALTANGTAGAFTVTAAVSGASAPATFTLTNL